MRNIFKKSNSSFRTRKLPKITQNYQKSPRVIESKNPLKFINYQCDNFKFTFIIEKTRDFFHFLAWKEGTFRMRLLIIDQCGVIPKRMQNIEICLSEMNKRP